MFVCFCLGKLEKQSVKKKNNCITVGIEEKGIWTLGQGVISEEPMRELDRSIHALGDVNSFKLICHMSHVRVLSILHIKLKQIPSSHRRISDQQQLSFECSRFGKTQKVKQYMEPSLQKE